MGTDDFLKIKIMQKLQGHKGRNNAIPRQKLFLYLQHWDQDIDDRKLRRLYVSLPICACPEGLFFPQTAAEVQEFRKYLEPKVGPIVATKRCLIIYAFYPDLAPMKGEQIGLF